MNLTEILLALLFSFTCACGFGICFGIKFNNIWLAGLAGLITRIVLIICEGADMDRFAYTLIAAFVGTIYAEIVGRIRKDSLAKYIYPAIVLLIPGDVLYHMILGIIKADGALFTSNIVELFRGLFGIALGCMIAPVFFRSFKKI